MIAVAVEAVEWVVDAEVVVASMAVPSFDFVAVAAVAVSELAEALVVAVVAAVVEDQEVVVVEQTEVAFADEAKKHLEVARKARLVDPAVAVVVEDASFVFLEQQDLYAQEVADFEPINDTP